MNSNIHSITSSCVLRRPKLVASRQDVVLYRPARGSPLATIAPETFICEACWNSWNRSTGADIPGQWARTEIRRDPGMTCDASDSRLVGAWLEVLASRLLQPVERELERRGNLLAKCAAEGGSYSEMYEVTLPPRNIPPGIPASYRPTMRVLICSKCYDQVDATPLAQYFQKVPAATNAKCVAGSHGAIAHSILVAASENDLDIFISTAWAAIYYATTVPAKQGHGNCSDNGMWFNLTPAIENFIICDACAHTLLWAFPVMRPLIAPEKALTPDEEQWVAQNGDPRVCDFSVASKRCFPTVLELYHAQANRSSSEFHTFATRIAGVQPCQGPREAKIEVQMYVSDTLLALDVCQDCYVTFFEHSDFGGVFHPAPTNKRFENPDFAEYNLACDLASPRVKAALDSVVSDLEHGVTDTFDPFREWLIVRRGSLQKLCLHQWTLRKQQLLQTMRMCHDNYMSTVYSGIGGIQSMNGSDGHLHGNSQIGWYENDGYATAAKFRDHARKINNLQPLQDVMGVEMQIQQLL